jgi:hypothetical protein
MENTIVPRNHITISGNELLTLVSIGTRYSEGLRMDSVVFYFGFRGGKCCPTFGPKARSAKAGTSDFSSMAQRRFYSEPEKTSDQQPIVRSKFRRQLKRGRFFKANLVGIQI